MAEFAFKLDLFANSEKLAPAPVIAPVSTVAAPVTADAAPTLTDDYGNPLSPLGRQILESKNLDPCAGWTEEDHRRVANGQLPTFFDELGKYDKRTVKQVHLDPYDSTVKAESS